MKDSVHSRPLLVFCLRPFCDFLSRSNRLFVGLDAEKLEFILNAAVILYRMIPPDAHSLGSEGRVVNGNWRDTSDVKEGSLPREVTKQVNGSLSSRTKQVNEFSKHTRFLVDISFSCCSLRNGSLWESAQKDELSYSFFELKCLL